MPEPTLSGFLWALFPSMLAGFGAYLGVRIELARLIEQLVALRETAIRHEAKIQQVEIRINQLAEKP